MPSKKIKPGSISGGTIDTNATFFLETESYYRGSQSIRVINGRPAKPPSEPTRNKMGPASVHTSFVFVEEFETYCADPIVAESDIETFWDATVSVVYCELKTIMDLTDYNLFSFYARGSGSFNFDVFFTDIYDVQSSTFSTQPMTNFWKRLDVTTSWGNCDPEKIEFVCFLINGPAETGFWLEDLVFIDKRPETEKITWVDLNVSNMNTNMAANNIYASTIGLGDVVDAGSPSPEEGELSFITHAPHDDADLKIIDTIARRGQRTYIRCANEGFPAYLLQSKANERDTYFGSNRRIQIDYVEDD